MTSSPSRRGSVPAGLSVSRVVAVRPRLRSANSLARGAGLRRATFGAHDLEPDVVGIAAFILVVALGVAWPLALVAGVAGYAARRLMLRRPASPAAARGMAGRDGDDAVQYPLGVTAKDVRRITGEARATIAGIRMAAAGIVEAPLRGKALALADKAERIVDELQSDPRHIPEARQFLHYQLEAAQRIVTQYARLSARGHLQVDVEETLAKVEPALDALSDAFDQQLESLLSREALDLDVELSVLQATVKLDG